MPLFLLARHSIELHLKDTIREYAKTDDMPADLGTHNLMRLWNQLGTYMERYGIPADDEWGSTATSYSTTFMRSTRMVSGSATQLREMAHRSK